MPLGQRGDEMEMRSSTRRTTAWRIATLVLVAAALLDLGAAAPTAAARSDGLARTPPMGWSTFMGLNWDYDEHTIQDTADLLVSSGMRDAGYTYVNIDGAEDVAADIRGHFFDLDAQAEQKGWSDEEKEIVARHMIRMCQRFPGGDFSLYSKPKLPAPWPRYDETHHAKIADLAEQLGLVAEALAYEKENKKRSSVISDLERILASKAEEELAAA